MGHLALMPSFIRIEALIVSEQFELVAGGFSMKWSFFTIFSCSKRLIHHSKMTRMNKLHLMLIPKHFKSLNYGLK
jgi:hypothetical protein